MPVLGIGFAAAFATKIAQEGLSRNNVQPAWLIVVVVLLGALCLLSLRGGGSAPDEVVEVGTDPVEDEEPAGSNGPLVAMLALMVLFVVVVGTLGFATASTALVVASMYLLGVRHLVPLLLMAVGTFVMVVVIFEQLLGVVLPDGTWGWW